LSEQSLGNTVRLTIKQTAVGQTERYFVAKYQQKQITVSAENDHAASDIKIVY
jgi:hypothetical protein